MPIFPSRLYVIIDPLDLGAAPSALAELALRGGAKTIQLRWKNANTGALLAEARKIADLARAAGARFIVNDRPDVALAAGADGVHLGQSDLPAKAARSLLGPDRIIGLSTHSPEQVERARHQPIDYLGFGPIYPTRSKKRADPVQGIAGLRTIRPLSDKPIVAIGGITEGSIGAVLGAGADAAALIGDIMRSGDVTAKVRSILRRLAGAGG